MKALLTLILTLTMLTAYTADEHVLWLGKCTIISTSDSKAAKAVTISLCCADDVNMLIIGGRGFELDLIDLKGVIKRFKATALKTAYRDMKISKQLLVVKKVPSFNSKAVSYPTVRFDFMKVVGIAPVLVIEARYPKVDKIPTLQVVLDMGQLLLLDVLLTSDRPEREAKMCRDALALSEEAAKVWVLR